MRPFLLISLFLLALPCLGQGPMHYEVSFPNAQHHEAQVTLTLTRVPNQPLRLRMSRSSPGRYATHEFAKNIYRLKASNGAGKPLTLVRVDPDSWEVPFPDLTVQVSYTLFGNRADGTYTDIDPIHAHLNMPACLLWAKGWEKQPITLSFLPPANAGWKVATQLKATGNPYQFTAPDLQYLMDSPTELSGFSLREWSVTNAGQQAQTMRLALHHNGTEQDVDAYVEMVKKVVLETKAVYGELPSFDYGTYTFIQDVLPDNDGDGMEHRNSTVITQHASIRTSQADLLGTVSHEFFHSWNVERIRPKSLEPFNFERANMSGELWFAEGFTTYYGELVLARSGFHDVGKFAQVMGSQLNGVLNAPASQAFSPVEMSRLAPFADAAVAIDPTNFANVFISYYPYGSVVGLALDLSLRSRFRNLTLDDYMRAMWKTHGKTEKPYTLTDLEQVLVSVTRDSSFAHTFFRKHILGYERPDYGALLARAGFLLRKVRPGAAFLGQQVGLEAGKWVVTAPTLIGTPLYAAGLDQGDVIVSIAHRSVNNANDYGAVLRKHKPGDTVPIRFVHRGSEQQTSVTFAEDPQLELVPYEKADLVLTQEMKAFRDRWLGTQADK